MAATPALLDTNADFHGTAYRNITSMRVAVDPFDDLVGDAAARAAAIAAEMRVRSGPPGVIHRGFAYSQAIDYPFSADRVVASRYGNGTHRVWYGALDEPTSLAETCYHQIQMLRAEAGIDRPVVRYRKVYAVEAAGLFVDVRAKAATFPALVADDYDFTQSVGQRLAREGSPGLLYPSARWPDGECLAAFRPEPLSNPRALYDLTYRIDAVAGTVAVERTPGVVQVTLNLAQLRCAPSA